jgi:nucleoside-diphosphate-sugar epimerase
MNNNSVLLTGATGFIGLNLAKRLVGLNYEVHVIARRSSNLSQLARVSKEIHIHFHNGSTAGMKSIMKSAQPDCVFHLASLFLAKHRSQDVTPLVRSNILFGTQLLEAMSECGVKEIINASTSWQHYQNSVYDPVCLYAATKQAFEDIMVYYHNVKSIKSISIELFDTYGPNDQRHKLFYLFKQASLSHDPIKMSPGEQLIDLVYIDDVIGAFLIAKERVSQEIGSAKYMLTSGNPIRLREIAAIYSKVTNTGINLDWGGLPYREREVMTPWHSGEKMPGWKPIIGLEQGIKLLIEGEKNNG